MVKDNKIQKIVYFDEESVTDYVQIVAGGKLEKTTELLKESERNLSAEGGATASVGITGIFKALMGFEAKAKVDINTDISLSTNRMVKNILKNTILTDFLDVLHSEKGDIKKFKDYRIRAQKDSLSYIIMISPYMTMLKGEAGIPAGDFNIAIDKMDNAIKSGKGYYEFIGDSGAEEVVLRFNIDSFKNNYKITDILKMNLSIYAIKVGMTTLDKLDIKYELSIDENNSNKKDNPSYDKNDKSSDKEKYDKKEMGVYDVLLAGVERND